MMESDGEYGDLSTVQDEPITHRPLFYGCLGIVTGGLGLASISVVPGPKFIIWAILLISVALIVGGSAIMIWGGWSRQTNVAIQAGFEVLPVPSSSVAVVHDELINVSIKFAPTKAQVAEANQAAIRYRTKKTRRVNESRTSLPGAKPQSPVFGFVVFVGLVIMFVLLVRNSRPSRSQPEQISPAVLAPSVQATRYLAFGLGAAGLVFFAAGVRLLKSCGKESAKPIHVDISSTTIVYSRPGYRESLSWSCFEGISNTRNLVVLHQPNGMCRFFPKCAFSSPEQLQGLNRIAAANVPQRPEPAMRAKL